ncbi:MAG: hypothetical protein ACRDKW_05600 [Actinomycetota bacterium]
MRIENLESSVGRDDRPELGSAIRETSRLVRIVDNLLLPGPCRGSCDRSRPGGGQKHGRGATASVGAGCHRPGRPPRAPAVGP